MDYAEFNALSRGLRSIPANKNPGTRISAGTDASAIHGRLSAQVALLQSPILPAADLPYTEKRSFPGFPVDKPHTRGSRLRKFYRIEPPPLLLAVSDLDPQVDPPGNRAQFQ